MCYFYTNRHTNAIHETVVSRIVEQMFVYIGHVSIFEDAQKGGGLSPQNFLSLSKIQGGDRNDRYKYSRKQKATPLLLNSPPNEVKVSHAHSNPSTRDS